MAPMHGYELVRTFHELTFATVVVVARALRENESHEGSEGGEGWFTENRRVIASGFSR